MGLGGNRNELATVDDDSTDAYEDMAKRVVAKMIARRASGPSA